MPPSQPYIQDGPIVEVVAEQPHNLTCHADNARPAANVSWESDRTKLSDETYYTYTTQEDGKRQDAVGMVTITPRRADQGKEYECIIMNDAMYMPLKVKATLEVLCKYHILYLFLPPPPLKIFS